MRMRIWFWLPVVAVLSAAGQAQADAIDGDWCSPGQVRSLRIEGPRIVTPGQQLTQGDYSRHAFAYVVPPGEPDAGMPVVMQLLGENDVRISFGGAEPEIWQRCDLSA
jgi:hypothetical protein